MRILVFSDIHSKTDNISSIVEKNSFDNIIFAGDIFGYFIGSNSVINFVLKNKIEFILGNHDLYFLRRLNVNHFKKKFSEYENLMLSDFEYKDRYGAIDETLINIKYEDVHTFYNSKLLKTLNIDSLQILICHGSPFNPFNEYLYPDSDKFNNIFATFKFDILICGHTHKQFIFKKGERYIINPGSCTLPRGENKPSYIIIETNPVKITLFESQQNIQYIIESKSKVKLIEK